MEKDMIQEASDRVNNIEMENKNADYEALENIEEALAAEEYKTAFRLFLRDITGILCRERILDVCSPYYHKNGKIKEDKIAAELAGVYEYYKATNDGFRSFWPHGRTFQCGCRTASFIGAVKKYVSLLAENTGSDPWKVYAGCFGSDYFDLENYLDRAAVYSFPHNCHSREVMKDVLSPYVEKNYGVMDAGGFIEWYQAMDRAYTTVGFPFACTTHAGWFFEGYDILYRKILDEGAWTLQSFWEQGEPCDWLRKQLKPYPEIQPSYEGLVKALQKPEYEHLLCRLFPFRLTADTLRAGCNMDADEWEEFTLMLAKALHFAECRIGRKNLPDYMVRDAVQAMRNALKAIRHYMDNATIQ